MDTRTSPAPLPADAARRMDEAMAAQQRGELALAEEGYRWLTQGFPGFAGAWHYYGLLCHQRGESGPARKMLRRAQTLAPNDAVFLLNFGRVLSEWGDYSQAIGCLERVLRFAPDNVQALLAYARAVVEAGRGGEAVTRLERSVHEQPADWRLWALLGKCREQANDLAGAQRAIDESVKLVPAGEAARHLSRAQAALGAHDAVTSELEFRAALQIEPRSGTAYLRLANLAMEAGESDRVREWARAALSRDDRLWRAWALLATNPQESRDEAFLPRLQEAARNAAQEPGAAPLHFALGWIHEQHGEYDEAFAAYALGNRIQGRHRAYDRALQEAYVDDLVEAVDVDFTQRASVVGVDDPGAIFICGMPRSGTTLIETVLASHPEVTAGGEMLYVHDWLRRTVGTSHLHKTGSWLRGAPDAQLHALAHEWHAHLQRIAAGAARVTDKMPGNYHLLGLIHACFPNAAIIYVHRDPRDSGLSCFTTHFERGHFFSHDLDSIGHYYQLHKRLMDHWRGALGPERLIEIKYEDLVARPEEEIRRLLSALSLSWDPACLRFYDHRRNVQTASLTQVRQPLYSTSVGRWRRFESYLGPLLEALGDPPLSPRQ
ncbi:MAG: tetratricopeptide repeat-containing sulfotransferase family protein [Gammaproteobacteria bacterium]